VRKHYLLIIFIQPYGNFVLGKQTHILGRIIFSYLLPWIYSDKKSLFSRKNFYLLKGDTDRILVFFDFGNRLVFFHP